MWIHANADGCVFKNTHTSRHGSAKFATLQACPSWLALNRHGVPRSKWAVLTHCARRRGCCFELYRRRLINVRMSRKPSSKSPRPCSTEATSIDSFRIGIGCDGGVATGSATIFAAADGPITTDGRRRPRRGRLCANIVRGNGAEVFEWTQPSDSATSSKLSKLSVSRFNGLPSYSRYIDLMDYHAKYIYIYIYIYISLYINI